MNKNAATTSIKRAMTSTAASRIQAVTAKAGDGQVRPGSFASRAQRAVDKNLAAGKK